MAMFQPSNGRKLACLFVALFFFAGLCAFAFNSPASAAVKKIQRKLVKRKKIVRKIKHKAPIKVKSHKIVKKAVKKKPAATRTSPYKLPAHGGVVTQHYYLDEGIDASETENVTEGLKTIGAEDVSIDTNKNTVVVRFDSSKLSSVGVISKMKAMGYTVKRID